jgi:hypothetical protein
MTVTESHRRWMLKNPEKVKAIRARNYKNNKEHERQYNKQWRKSLKEEIPMSPRALRLYLKFRRLKA